MSIKNKEIKGLQELQSTLQANAHIEKVYFSANGAHYFNVHELINDGKKTGKFFGYLDSKVVADEKSKDKKFKRVSVANNTEIVETMTANEVLNFKAKGVPTKKEETEKV